LCTSKKSITSEGPPSSFVTERHLNYWSPVERSPFVLSRHGCVIEATHCHTAAAMHTSVDDQQDWQARNLGQVDLGGLWLVAENRAQSLLCCHWSSN